MKRMFRFVNKVVVFLSETPLHLLFSHQVMVLRFRGRRTGKHYAIPVSYGRDEMSHKLICMTDVSGVWWKNLLAVDVIEISSKANVRSFQPALKCLIIKQSVEGWLAFADAVG